MPLLNYLTSTCRESSWNKNVDKDVHNSNISFNSEKLEITSIFLFRGRTKKIDTSIQ